MRAEGDTPTPFPPLPKGGRARHFIAQRTPAVRAKRDERAHMPVRAVTEQGVVLAPCEKTRCRISKNKRLQRKVAGAYFYCDSDVCVPGRRVPHDLLRRARLMNNRRISVNDRLQQKVADDHSIVYSYCTDCRPACRWSLRCSAVSALSAVPLHPGRIRFAGILFRLRLCYERSVVSCCDDEHYKPCHEQAHDGNGA